MTQVLDKNGLRDALQTKMDATTSADEPRTFLMLTKSAQDLDAAIAAEVTYLNNTILLQAQALLASQFGAL